MIKAIDKISDGLAFAQRSLLVIFVLVMVGLSFLQVVLRNVFSFGFLWADPFLRYIVVWVGFLGAILATKEEKHFGVDILNRFLSPRAIHAVKTIIDILACIVAFLLAKAAIQFLFEAIGSEEKDLFDLPRRLYFSIIPIGFGLMTLEFFFNVIRNGRKFFTNASNITKQQSSETA